MKSSSRLWLIFVIAFVLIAVLSLGSYFMSEPPEQVVYVQYEVTREVEYHDPLYSLEVDTHNEVSDSGSLTQTITANMPETLDVRTPHVNAYHSPLPEDYSYYVGLCENPLRPPSDRIWKAPDGVITIVLCTERLRIEYEYLDDISGGPFTITGRGWTAYDEWEVKTQVAFAMPDTMLSFEATTGLGSGSFWPGSGAKYILISSGKISSLKNVEGWVVLDKVHTGDAFFSGFVVDSPVYVYQYTPGG